MRKPRPLRTGDLIRFVSPSSAYTAERLEPMFRLLEGEGYRVELAPHAGDKLGYLAGTDEDRARDLQEAFDDPAVAAVFCTRGGYGCSRLLKLLDLDRIAESGKLFVGYSDLTILHLALLRRGVAGIYGAMGTSFDGDKASWMRASFLQAIKGGNPVPPDAPRGTCLTPGSAQGVLVGGCVRLVCDSIGTPDVIEARERIVLLEDVGEAPHRVDAMLTQLLNCGILQSALGIVVGEMTGTDAMFDEKTGPGSWRDIVRERLAPLGIPSIIDFPCGHMTNMLSLPLGLKVRLDADAGSLDYLETL